MNQHKIDLLRHKRDEIKNLLDNQDIICLAETWTTQGEEILLWDDPLKNLIRKVLESTSRAELPRVCYYSLRKI